MSHPGVCTSCWTGFFNDSTDQMHDDCLQHLLALLPCQACLAVRDAGAHGPYHVGCWSAIYELGDL